MNLTEEARHAVHFYEEEQALIQNVGEFFGASLGAGGAGVMIATQGHRTMIEAQLADQGLNVAAVKSKGRLISLDTQEALARVLPNGSVDIPSLKALVEELLDQATAEGRTVRVFSDAAPFLVSDGKGEIALELERLWNELVNRADVFLLCGYPIQAFDAPAERARFEAICEQHTSVYSGGTYQPIPPSSESPGHAFESLQQRTVALESEVEERKRAEDTLREQSRTLQILQHVASSLVAEQDLENILRLVADAGCVLAGAAYGAFLYHQSFLGEQKLFRVTCGLDPNETLELIEDSPETLLRSSFRDKSLVRLDDAPPEAQEGLPTPIFRPGSGDRAIRSYLAAPVSSMNGEVLGGLFFASPHPNAFSSASEQLVSTLAAQAAVAIDNANLHAALRRELTLVQEAEVASRHLAAIVESSEDAIISKNLDGIIQTWNTGAQRIFGYTPEEIIGKPVTTLFPPGHLNEEPAIIARIRKGERVDHYETQRQRKDGSILDISLTISPVRNGQGEIVGASKIARDISQRKRDEEALRQLTEELAKSRDELELRVEERTRSLREAIAQMEEFSYTVSHDLRAPLRAMSVHSTVLTEDFRELLEGEPEAMKSVQRIAENTARLDKMIRDVLTYGRVARDELNLEPVSLDQLVRDTIYHYPVLQPPNAVILVEPLASVIGHEPSLVQVISNLLNNAVKFVAPGVTPTVHVWTEPVGDKVRLWVQDNGIGIEPKYQHRLFGMFERVHPKLPYEGTGVGLAIVRKAAERMGGQVGVESDGANGTRFWVELQGTHKGK